MRYLRRGKSVVAINAVAQRRGGGGAAVISAAVSYIGAS